MKDTSLDTPAIKQGLYERHCVVTRRHKLVGSDAGFSLVELIVVSVIIGVLAGLAIPAYHTFVEKVKVTTVVAEIRGLEKDVLAAYADSGVLPNSLNDVGRGLLLDPWGNPYQYLNFANAGARRQGTFFDDLNTDFDLFSLGPDGLTQQVISDANSLDDIVRVNDGGWVGSGREF